MKRVQKKRQQHPNSVICMLYFTSLISSLPVRSFLLKGCLLCRDVHLYWKSFFYKQTFMTKLCSIQRQCFRSAKSIWPTNLLFLSRTCSSCLYSHLCVFTNMAGLISFLHFWLKNPTVFFSSQLIFTDDILFWLTACSSAAAVFLLRWEAAL